MHCGSNWVHHRNHNLGYQARQSQLLDYDEIEKYTSGTPARSGGNPANFGVVHWSYVHQQSGSDEGYVKPLKSPVEVEAGLPLG